MNLLGPKSRRLPLLAAILAVTVLGATWSIASSSRTLAVTASLFRNFNGVVYLPGPNITQQAGIGWTREPFYWNLIEPKKGTWNWTETDQKVAAAKAERVKILPMLAYNVGWGVAPGGTGFSPPERTEDWEDYVEHVVARYSAPPFNLRYFQIWNEPTRKAGFFTGTDQEFVDKVYLPAAKIIRRNHCFVVFGGWPASNSLQEYDSVLEYHNAWKWTDILDVHYEGLPHWQYLYNRWIKPGKCKGVWETELGFTADPDFIPATYLPMLHWSLEVGWSNADAYKLFWYAAWGAGPDGPKCLTQTDSKGQVVLSDQGKRLAVLNQLLGAGPLGVFNDYQVTPSAVQASTMGFTSGRRVVIAMLFDRTSIARIHSVSVRLPLEQKPASVGLMDEDGDRLHFPDRFRNRFVTVKIPRQSLNEGAGKLAIAYLDVDPSAGR